MSAPATWNITKAPTHTNISTTASIKNIPNFIIPPIHSRPDAELSRFDVRKPEPVARGAASKLRDD